MKIKYNLFSLFILFLVSEIFSKKFNIEIPVKSIENRNEKEFMKSYIINYLEKQNFDTMLDDIPSKTLNFSYPDSRITFNITVGTPPQSFIVYVMNTNSDVMIYDITCETYYCALKDQFVPFYSKTYQNKDINFTFSNGNYIVEAHLATDIVSVANLTVNNFSFLDITYDNKTVGEFSYYVFDGTIGLATSNNSVIKSPNLIESLYLEDKINEASYSLYLTKHLSLEGSKLIIGGINHNYFKGEIYYYPLNNELTGTFAITGLKVGTTTLYGVRSAAIDFETVSITSANQTLINDINRLVGNINLECENLNQLPNLTIITQFNDIVLTAEAYTYRMFQNFCLQGFQQKTSSFYSNDVLILGLTFIREYYYVFDYTRNQVGIAKSINY